MPEKVARDGPGAWTLPSKSEERKTEWKYTSSTINREIQMGCHILPLDLQN